MHHQLIVWINTEFGDRMNNLHCANVVPNRISDWINSWRTGIWWTSCIIQSKWLFTIRFNSTNFLWWKTYVRTDEKFLDYSKYLFKSDNKQRKICWCLRRIVLTEFFFRSRKGTVMDWIVKFTIITTKTETRSIQDYYVHFCEKNKVCQIELNYFIWEFIHRTKENWKIVVSMNSQSRVIQLFKPYLGGTIFSETISLFSLLSCT